RGGGEPREDRVLRGNRRLPLQARGRARRPSHAHVRDRHAPWADRSRKGDRACRRRARCARDPDLRGGAVVLGTAQGVRIGITGLGVHVPEKVMTNDELAELVETSDEWIRERTGIRERRIASREEALTDIALPAARAALEDAGVEAADIDLLICATVTPDMMFPTSSALLADALG